MISTPVSGSASKLMSGVWRMAPGRLLCHDGLGKTRLGPPPAPNWNPRFNGGLIGELPVALVVAIPVKLFPQPDCQAIPSLESSARLVPPIEVAKGELAGKPTVFKPTNAAQSPWSPVTKLT